MKIGLVLVVCLALGMAGPGSGPETVRAEPTPISHSRPRVTDELTAATTTTTTAPTTTAPPEASQAPQTEAAAPPAPRASTYHSEAVYGTGACGGPLPPCYRLATESGGNITAVNPTGCGGYGCFGKWQFDPRTSNSVAASLGWDELVGVPASEWSEEQQDTAAATLYDDGNGCSHWAVC